MLAQAAREQHAILTEAELASAEFLKKDSIPAFLLWRRLHLPLLLLLLLASLLSPWRYASALLSGSLDFSFLRWILLPIFPSIVWIIFAAGWDKILEHRNLPDWKDENYSERRNLILYLSLPVSGTALFFFIHPVPGFAASLLAIAVTCVRGVRLGALHHGLSLKQSIYYFLGTAAFFQFCLLLLLLLYNAIMTARVGRLILDRTF